MAKGLSLHIGLNTVDAGHYQGWSGPLTACEFDANDMTLVAKQRGFQPVTLLTREATRENVLAQIGEAAHALKAGDMFFLSYSGHGGQVPDLNGDEDDAEDETWCLYDGQLVDDEIYAALGRFASHVRITVLSDSCHSGTVTRMALMSAAAHDLTTSNRYKAMPNGVAQRTFLANREFYEKIAGEEALRAGQDVKAPTILISGCQDNQLSRDGDFNGLFTAMLKRVWNGGKFSRDYRAFHRKIGDLMPPDQTPKLTRVGPRDADFLAQQPFTI